ncbi:hypothetical protein O9G_002934 [Rozella allomycis CSF55]|uniref:EF-hand domain-containing protein n=1 Tax=Rozella allomycis (strain CSF55) TaxID=988480 RepID=A0A075ANK2_ROZAC|nr:hypothetical protein O9G_002934 [Rozella allomycis CSF55]|eukprot:EPZ31465.1 hypothetical protein O9G_002934 [Rozella allomycis CSF55]
MLSDDLENKKQVEEYFEKHNVPILFERMMSSLLYYRPENPKAFLIEQLKLYEQFKELRPPILVFNRDDIAALFKTLDVTRKGYISFEQYEQALKNLGATNASMTPKGFKENMITLETFLDEA